MSLSRGAAIISVLGGLLWAAAAVLNWGADVRPLLYELGLATLLVALAGLGYSLVDHAPVWLRLVVSAATPLLGLMLWIMVVDVVPANSPVVMLAAVGMVIGGLIALPRTRNAQSRAPARGRRAAR